MAVRARGGGLLDTGSVRGGLVLVALGLFLIGYGGVGAAADDAQTILLVLHCFAVAAGAAFLLAAFFGALAALRQRRR